jgi:hypothetical protein
VSRKSSKKKGIAHPGPGMGIDGRFSRLYRGIVPPILMEAPKRATKFAANDSWGTFYKNAFGMPTMTQNLSILTGATAGATEAFVVVPFELVKIRLQDRAQAGRYNGSADAVVKIIREEGPLALYNGLEATLWRYLCQAIKIEADSVDTFGGMRGILGAFILFVHDCRKQLQSKENSATTSSPVLSAALSAHSSILLLYAPYFSTRANFFRTW